MATLGTSVGSTPSGGWHYDANTNRQFYQNYTMPSPGGYITDQYVYFGAYSSATNCQFVLWQGGSVIYQSSVFSEPAYPATNGGQHWEHIGGLNIYVPSGASLGIGVWAAGAVDWTDAGAGSYVQQSTSGPTSQGGGTSGSPAWGMYVVYTPLTTPTISNATPSPVLPGGTLTVTGTGFLHASSVTLGGTSCTFSATSDTAMTVTVPSNSSGTQSLVVTNPAGSSSGYSVIVGGIAWVNTGTSAAPVWTQGVVYVNTGTPASPVWTVAGSVQVNTGTSASPVWTNGS